MKTIAEVSERVSIENRGTTFEGRPILLLTVTSKKNHENIEAIQEAHLANTEGTSVDIKNQPLVIYQGFSIHGNEPSGANAGLAISII
jgi:GH15 family glucan-1,4-alpha-glucosidase